MLLCHPAAIATSALSAGTEHGVSHRHQDGLQLCGSAHTCAEAVMTAAKLMWSMREPAAARRPAMLSQKPVTAAAGLDPLADTMAAYFDCLM